MWLIMFCGVLGSLNFLSDFSLESGEFCLQTMSKRDPPKIDRASALNLYE